MQFATIPRPNVITPCPGFFKLASARDIYLAGPHRDTHLEWIGQYLADWLATQDIADVNILSDILGKDRVPAGSIRLELDQSTEALSRGSYHLVVNPDSLTVKAHDTDGVFHGVQTLKQLIASATTTGQSGHMPCVRIKDEPRFPWRGFMLDSARHLQSVAEIKKIIDRIASLKLNRFHWHLADDQGWRLEIRKYPRLTSVGAWRGEGPNRYGGYYTQQQAREIVNYAKDRCVTVIPEIDMPGHCNAALHAYPRLSCTGKPINADAEGGLDAYTRHDGRLLFCAGRDEVLTFLKDVLTEVAEVFDPPFIHLGGDERPSGIWSDCPRCQRRMKDLGLDSEDELEYWFASQIAQFAHDHLKIRTIGWGDNLKKAGMPKGQVVQGWLEGQSAMAVGMGRQTINSFHEWVYLDYPWCKDSQEGKPDWMPLLPIKKVYDFEPVPEGTGPEASCLVLGGEAPVWTEHIRTFDSLIKHIWPRLQAFSEALWCAREVRDYTDFKQRVALCNRTKRITAISTVSTPKVIKAAGRTQKVLDKASN